MMGAEAYEAISDGVAKSTSLRRFIIHNSNVHEQNNFQVVCKGLAICSSLEYIDFQLCNLNDKHWLPIRHIMKGQFDTREMMSWKYNLRKCTKVKVDNVGLKMLNLAKNNFGNEAVVKWAEQLEVSDKYLRCINLRYNKVGRQAIERLYKAAAQHSDLLSVDVRDNPGYLSKTAMSQICKWKFLSNLRKQVVGYHKTRLRIKIEWVIGSCIGMTSSRLEERSRKHVIDVNRQMFNSLVSYIARHIELPF